jgi:hypothetical protein
MMTRHRHLFHLILLGAITLSLAAPSWAAQFPEARIFIEYNSTDNDLGFHVFLDAEDWKRVTITNPAGNTIFQVEGKGAFGALGLSELFFEGAEPSLDEVPLGVLLSRMPEGQYTFKGVTVAGRVLTSKPRLSHAVPAGPVVTTSVIGDDVTISWEPVTGPPDGFPNRAINIVGYQVIVEPFQITLPASSTSMELPDELIEALGPGEHGFEVLAIDATGNQTITAGSFETN